MLQTGNYITTKFHKKLKDLLVKGVSCTYTVYSETSFSPHSAQKF